MMFSRQFGLVLLVITCLFLTSCASLYYNSTILGHDSVEFPIPEKPQSGDLGSLAVVVKGAPTISLFTQDSTSSLQLGIVYIKTFQISDNFRYFLGFGSTGFIGNTTIYNENVTNGYSSSYKQTFSSYGFTGEFKPGIIDDEVDWSAFYGFDIIYGQDFGDYNSYRSTLKSYDLDANTGFDYGLNQYNMSPNGSTLSFLLNYLNKKQISPDASFSFGGGIGVGFSNWPEDSYHTFLTKISVIFSTKKYWWWVDFEDMNILNAGLGIGVGVYIF